MKRYVIAVLMLLVGFMPHPTYADGIPLQQTCNNFNFMQVVMLYEAPNSSILNMRFIGYAVRTKGVCFVDNSFYSGLKKRLQAYESCGDDLDCQLNQFLFASPGNLRENAAIAADADLNDLDPPIVYHFDRLGSTAEFFNSPIACPVVRGWVLDDPENPRSRVIPIRTFNFKGDQTVFC